MIDITVTWVGWVKSFQQLPSKNIKVISKSIVIIITSTTTTTITINAIIIFIINITTTPSSSSSSSVSNRVLLCECHTSVDILVDPCLKAVSTADWVEDVNATVHADFKLEPANPESIQTETHEAFIIAGVNLNEDLGEDLAGSRSLFDKLVNLLP
ncbi:hypothetical protein ElyMa_000793300 [Elysia marginata]|uniref:Uncharacterized protein n=1 Tax=Elysia marginata TaxID=1093978 RepID=A0AAV4GW36_9GAST|nr:hypothetical protein ElyMa_000793300 [Elysia marginata]